MIQDKIADVYIVYLLSFLINYNSQAFCRDGKDGSAAEDRKGEEAEERMDEKSRTNNDGRKVRREQNVFLEI